MLTASAPHVQSIGPQTPAASPPSPVQPRPDTWPRAQWISALGAAQAEARASRKPLLVFVVPDELGAARVRGELLGAVLERADEEFLIDLACCEVACAPASELHRLTGELLLPIDPLAVLAEYDANLFAARSIRVAPYTELARGELADCETACQRALQQLIRGDGGRAGIAARQREANATELPGVLAGVRDGASLPTWLVDRWAPQLAELAEPAEPNAPTVPPTPAESDAAAQRSFVRARLLATARREYIEEPPRGSAWAIQQGFVFELDGQRSIDTCPPCGMGHVTADAKRFLAFYGGTEFERIGKGR
ncbi:MAG: hypothetical protein EPO68_14710 [Planctomycetota bacterium]|nr:MAG: hypothetical protein EPO68_14710 [Planctomycetota bacterium]